MTITCSCSGDSPNDSGVSTPSLACWARSGDTGRPYTVCGVSTRNATGWIGHERARRQHRPLHALLAAVLHEAGDVGEVPELRLVHRALRADRQGIAHLCDDHADLAGRDLHPRELRDVEHRPELETQAGHQQRGLVSGLAAERDGVVLVELAEREAFGDEPDLGGADGVERLPHQEQQQYHRDDDDDDPGTHGSLPFLAGTTLTRRATRQRSVAGLASVTRPDRGSWRR